jgi:ribosomal protein S18 acetylase RimI-like enzyme
MKASSEQKIKYRLCQETDADDMSRLLGEVFAKRDPPAVAVGLEPSEFEAFVRLFCRQAVDQELTIVAHCAETGEMCGALLTEDSASGLPDGIDQISEKFDPIFDILEQLDEEYRGGEDADSGESIHLLLLGVKPRFAGKGVAQEMISICLANGARRSYRMAVTEATNKASQHVFQKLGFVERVMRPYGTHMFDGRHPFESIVDQGGPMLMDKTLITMATS